jgi:hypothetical protein
LTQQSPPSDPPRYWAKSATDVRWGPPQDASTLRRFIGGSPVAVALKLAIVSLLVGAMLVWLDIRPAEVYREISDLLTRVWALGFQSIRQFGDYMIAGAVIVVPVWLVLRLLSYRGR